MNKEDYNKNMKQQKMIQNVFICILFLISLFCTPLLVLGLIIFSIKSLIDYNSKARAREVSKILKEERYNERD